MKSVEAYEGEDVEYKVKVAGSPSPDVKFLKDNRTLKEDENHIIIKEGNSYTLLIQNSKSSDAGTYSCVASNEFGTQSSEGDLSIKIRQFKPSFTKKMQDYEAKEGDEMIEFNVKVEGSPTPTIKWFHEGDQLKSPEFKFVDDGNSHTLIIPKVTAEKSGKYTCEASNTEGKTQSSGTLSVNAAPVFTKKLEDINTVKGQEIRLSVTVVGHPTPKLKWFKDNQEIKVDNKHIKYFEEDLNNYTLIINSFEESDVGQYRVEATNVFGKAETKSEVKTTTKPVFIKGLTDIEAKENDTNIELVVTTDHQSFKPVIKWFIDESEIKKDDQRYKLTEDENNDTFKLIIKEANENVAGEYKCVAANTYGKNETTAKFFVFKMPNFITGLRNIEADEGETVSLNVKVDGSPTPDVKFVKDGKDLSAESNVTIKKEGEKGFVMTIMNIKYQMSGEYECQISNKLGKQVSKGTVTVLRKSKDEEDKSKEKEDLLIKKKLPSDVDVTPGKPLNLEAKVDEQSDVQWFKDGVAVESSEDVKIIQKSDGTVALKIEQTQPEDSGKYELRASGSKGESVSSSDVKVGGKNNFKIIYK